MVKIADAKHISLLLTLAAWCLTGSAQADTIKLAANTVPPEQADTGGQALFTEGGNLFMEEVDSPKPKPKPKLIPIDLSRVGVSVSPSGNIVPTKDDPNAPWAGTGIKPFINQTQQYTELIPQSYFYNQGPYPGTGYLTPGYYPGLSGGVNRGYYPGYSPYFNGGIGYPGYGAGGYPGIGYPGYGGFGYPSYGYPGYGNGFSGRGLLPSLLGLAATAANQYAYGGYGYPGYSGYGAYPGYGGYGGYSGYGMGGYPGYGGYGVGYPNYNNVVPPGAVNLRLGNMQVGLGTNPFYYPRTTTQSSMWRSFNLGF